LIDVTPQVLEFHRIYGGSDNTNPAYSSSSRSLNYSEGGTIQRPENELVTDIPRELNYQDSVGLFGSENHYIKLNVRLENPISADNITINEYETAVISEERAVDDDEYTDINEGGPIPPHGQAYIDPTLDLVTVNDYEPAELSNEIISNISSKYLKVELNNLKTGNKYIDAWLDVRLYNKNYDEHPYDVMYIKHNEPFYIGFHARNTRRLPYNALCTIGAPSDDPKLPSVAAFGEFDLRLLATKP